MRKSLDFFRTIAPRLRVGKLCASHWAGLLLAAVASPALANEPFMGKCLLEVKAKRYLNGPCLITLDTEGNFLVRNVAADKITYFATVSVVSKTEAEGHWNGKMGTLDAGTSLGTLKRKGACWQNDDAKVCAWK